MPTAWRGLDGGNDVVFVLDHAIEDRLLSKQIGLNIPIMLNTEPAANTPWRSQAAIHSLPNSDFAGEVPMPLAPKGSVRAVLHRARHDYVAMLTLTRQRPKNGQGKRCACEDRKHAAQSD